MNENMMHGAELMNTQHDLLPGDARDLELLDDESIDLVVTSPPYPMIEMWDHMFERTDPRVGAALARKDGVLAFELMHAQLDRVWAECHRVLRPGRWACVNVGDAVRTLGDFQLYPNHARIIHGMVRAGFTPQPDLLWRKPTNSPTKFMGSGTLPCTAYVTLEREHILLFRKGGNRVFAPGRERGLRRRSAIFWEERNAWFSDLWMDLPGVGQRLAKQAARHRSGAFPLELPYRLILMHSVYDDTVLDPFVGTGTTSVAAAVTRRNSVGVDVEESLLDVARSALETAVKVGRGCVAARLAAHRAFVVAERSRGRRLKHRNEVYGFPVKTRPEKKLVLYQPAEVLAHDGDQITVRHEGVRNLTAKGELTAS